MATQCDDLADRIRGLLDRLVASRRLDNDDQEAIGMKLQLKPASCHRRA